MSDYKSIPIYKDYDFSQTLPLLTKKEISRGFPLNWQTTEVQQRIKAGDVEWITTSGTTSDRLQVIRPKAWRQQQIALSYQYHPLLNELWQKGVKRAVLTTAVCSQMVCMKKDNTIDKRWVDRSLYLNLHHNPNQWQQQDIERMLYEMNQLDVYILDADPMYLALFVKALNRFNLIKQWQKPSCITLCYELCTHNICHYLTKQLAVPIINLYGSTELGYLLLKENKSPMTLCSDKTSFELLNIDDDNQFYELVVSSDKNPYMPLLRYQTGDCIEAYYDQKGEVCIKRVLGRVSQLYQTINNKKLTHQHLDDVISQCCVDMMIYQFCFYGNKKAILNYTVFTDNDLSEIVKQNLVKQLTLVLELDVELKLQCEISPSHSGKFCWQKSI